MNAARAVAIASAASAISIFSFPFVLGLCPCDRTYIGLLLDSVKGWCEKIASGA